jgi:hypothetical protein
MAKTRFVHNKYFIVLPVLTVNVIVINDIEIIIKLTCGVIAK